MKQFDHEYMSIVDNLRIMGDALVLLNPMKGQLPGGSHSVQVPGGGGSKMGSYAPDANSAAENQTNFDPTQTHEGNEGGEPSKQASQKKETEGPDSQMKITDEIQALVADGASDF